MMDLRQIAEQPDGPTRRCSVCRAKVVVRHPDGVVIHNAILKVDSTGRVDAKRAHWKAWVEVPLRYVG